MAGTPRRGDEERRKIFRRMEWVFVYAPPILAAWVAASASLLLALFVPIPGTTFWGRWAIGMIVILVLPTIGYLAWSRIKG